MIRFDELNELLYLDLYIRIDYKLFNPMKLNEIYLPKNDGNMKV